MSLRYELIKIELFNVKKIYLFFSIAKMCFNVAINEFLMTHENGF